ncbi:MAG: proline dehydrogenase family protein [Acidobacteriota bacterium]
MIVRSLLLGMSESAWLREHATRWPFVRRAVSRFMPGEMLADMLAAARVLRDAGIEAVFTKLGENVASAAEAEAVARHYVEAVATVRAAGLGAEPSVKLTQLGLDIDRDRAWRHLQTVAEAAHAAGLYLWIDMEQSRYVDVTLDLAERARAEFRDVGVCLQAYLYRTEQDLDRMLRAGVGVRLVKGAYQEPASLAFPKKADVDRSFEALGGRMLEQRAARVVFGTHDAALIARLCDRARALGAPPRSYEFHFLYGIQRAEQARLVAAGEGVRVLVAYGDYWFPWYMRRLAERPANVWFVLRSLVGG